MINDSELLVAAIISGGGSTIEAIYKAILARHLPNIRLVALISTNPNAGGIQKLKDLGFDEDDILVAPKSKYPMAEDRDRDILKFCKERGANFYGQYGSLATSTEVLIDGFPDMIINQHPANPGSGGLGFGGEGLYGLHVHAAVWYYYIGNCAASRSRYPTTPVDYTRPVSHRVSSIVDGGAIVNHRPVPIFQDDTPEVIQNRVLPFEHYVQIETLALFQQGIANDLILPRLIPPGREQLLQEALEFGRDYGKEKK